MQRGEPCSRGRRKHSFISRKGLGPQNQNQISGSPPIREKIQKGHLNLLYPFGYHVCVGFLGRTFSLYFPSNYANAQRLLSGRRSRTNLSQGKPLFFVNLRTHTEASSDGDCKGSSTQDRRINPAKIFSYRRFLCQNLFIQIYVM